MNSFKLASIEIDKQNIIISPDDKNLVEVARKLNINIPAPCLKNKRRDGCCKACLVEINGKKDYACSTKPKANMTVTVRTTELDSIRKESIKEFKKRIKNGTTTPCQG